MADRVLLRIGGGSLRVLRDERGQIFPLLGVLLVSLVALGLFLFQAGRASKLRADAQTGADAAALAGAQEVADQFAGPAEEIPGGIDDGAVEAKVAEFAEKNGVVLVDFEREELAVRVTVRTEESLGEDAAEMGSEDVTGQAGAQAEADPIAAIVGPAGPGAGGALGAPLEGVASDVKDAIELAREMGLDITSTTGGRHAPGSYHYSGKAVDVAGPPAQMSRFFNAALERYGSGTLELFYDPKGFYVKNGSRVGGAIGGHSDHVHIALNGQGPAKGSAARDRPSEGSRGSAESGQSPGRRSADGSGGGSGSGASGEERARAQRVGVGECGGPVFETIYAVGLEYGASEKQMLAAFETALVESNGCNIAGGDRDSLGVFQQRPSMGWGTRSQILDVQYAAGKFFAGAKRAPQGGSAGNLAQSVQRSAFPERYDQRQAQARRLMAAAAKGDLPVIEGLPGGVGADFGGGAMVRLVPYGDE